MGVGSRAVRDLAAQHAQHARDGSCLVAVGRGGPKLLEQPPIPGSLVGVGVGAGAAVSGGAGLPSIVNRRRVPVAWGTMWERCLWPGT
jgi:hypothetical protein